MIWNRKTRIYLFWWIGMTRHQFLLFDVLTLLVWWISVGSQAISKLGLFLRCPATFRNLARCPSRGPAHNRSDALVAYHVSIRPRLTIQLRQLIVNLWWCKPKSFRGADSSSFWWKLVITGVYANGTYAISCSTLATSLWSLVLAEIIHRPFFFRRASHLRN